MRFSLRACVVVLALAGAALCLPPGVDTRQLPTRLLTEADLIHQGSFTIPDMVDLGVPWANGGAPQYCTYTQGVIAFNPANNALFLVCHVHTQTVAEISIPPLGGQASQLQAPRDPLEGRINTLQPPGGPSGSKQIGGMYVSGNRLIISAFVYYDADPNFQAIASHFVRDVNVSAVSVQGPYRIGTTLKTAFYAGYMNPIPVAWRAALGNRDFLTGQCCLGIVSRTSYGPSVSGITLAQLLAGVNPTPATNYVAYPEPNVLAAWDSTGPLFNGSTIMRGVVMPENTATTIFFGLHGMGQFRYVGGVIADPYEPHLWFYNNNDFVATVNGGNVWTPRPYRTARLPGLTRADIGGVALDPATGRIFVTENYGDGVKPRIHVFLISGSGGGGTPPPTDTIAPTVTSFTATPLPAQANTLVSVAASATDNIGVTSVDFTVNGVVAAIDTTAPYTFAWTPTTAATYTLRAIARDAAGNQGLSSTISASITAAPPSPADTTPPVISSFTVTPSTLVVEEDALLTASVSDNVGVVAVEFLNGTHIMNTDTVAPYSYLWPGIGSPNVFSFSARARDAAGNTATSAPVTVTINPIGTAPVDCVVSAFGPWSAWVPISATTEQRTRTRTILVAPANGGAPCPALTETETRPIVVVPPPDTTAPLVSLSAVSNATVGIPITLSANATDAVGVVGVRFTVNGATILDDTTAPYTTPWTPTTPGTFTLLAAARDAAGNVGLSNTIAVGVTDPTPPPGPGPSVSVTLTTSRCRITIPQFSGTPDGNPGWKMQIRVNTENFGSADITDPYASPQRTREVGLGTYVMTILWTKSGQNNVVQALGTFVCAP